MSWWLLQNVIIQHIKHNTACETKYSNHESTHVLNIEHVLNIGNIAVCYTQRIIFCHKLSKIGW
jgi:hypothetical protein